MEGYAELVLQEEAGEAGVGVAVEKCAAGLAGGVAGQPELRELCGGVPAVGIVVLLLVEPQQVAVVVEAAAHFKQVLD